ncbi:hypothetical protein QFC21_007091 [Naganishia friedmannii]|uniref:Uncharacterized protein n=1 Tax=Naganishia friedmannii TaxID=89922 RepID=A0ACC2UY78_9TREE|nr:hypothetical protein QFC21_007091 [Naganishia friedmannii]
MISLPTLAKGTLFILVYFALLRLLLRDPKITNTHTQSPLLPQSLIKELDNLRKSWDVGGVSVTTVKREKAWKFDEWQTQTVGLGEADDIGTPVDETTQFAIASNTKLFTVLAVGLAIHNEASQGPTNHTRLTWNSLVKDFVPEWRLMDPVASDRTDFSDLLSHRIGISAHHGAYNAREDKSDVIARMRYLRPSADFRKHFQYCNLCYVVASTISERLYGIPFTRYVADNILTPLGMRDTYFDGVDERRTQQRSQAYIRDNQDFAACIKDEEQGTALSKECLGERVDIGVTSGSTDVIAGQGGLVTSARDMAVWMKTLLLDGRSPWTNDIIFPYDIMSTTSTPHTVFHNPYPQDHHLLIQSDQYGLGQFISSYGGHQVLWHYGASMGQKSRVTRVPSLGLGVSIMANDNEFGLWFAQAAEGMILNHLMGLEPVDWRSRLKHQRLQWYKSKLPVVRVPNASLPTSISLSSIAGVYENLAYGKILICAVPTYMPIGYRANLPLPLPDCKETLANNPFAKSDFLSGGSNASPTYIAHFDKLWSDYLLFKHYNASVFTVKQSSFFPDNNVSSSSPFGHFEAEFGPSGMAWMGNAWGSEPNLPDDKRDRAFVNDGIGEGWQGDRKLRDRAEVWFEKGAETET